MVHVPPLFQTNSGNCCGGVSFPSPPPPPSACVRNAHMNAAKEARGGEGGGGGDGLIKPDGLRVPRE